MTYIYISYEPVDHALAAHVKGVLEASGFTSWYDETRLEPTTHPNPPRIEDVIFASAALVGVVSQSGATPRVLQEAEYARQLGKPVYWLQNVSDLDAVLARLPGVVTSEQEVYTLPRPFDFNEFEQNELDNAPSPTFFVVGGVLTLIFMLLALYGIVIAPSVTTPPSALTQTASIQVLMFTLSAPAPAVQVISSPTPRPAFPTAIPTATPPAVAILPSATPMSIPTRAETSTAAPLDLTLTSIAIALTQAAQQTAVQPTVEQPTPVQPTIDSANLAAAPSLTPIPPTATTQTQASETPSPVPASATPSFTWTPSPSPTLAPSQTAVPPTLTPSWTNTAGITPSVTASLTWTRTASHTVTLTHTPSPSLTLTPTVTLTPTAAAARFPIGFDNRAWTPDVQVYQNTNLVFVPAGCYLSISADASVQPEEICVESYWLGQYEVTNAAYAACVNAGVCSPPASFASSTRLNYYDSPAFADFPIINVTWQQATDYAVWLGGRLPTSSEWRYAAQGPANFLYPWGSDEPTETRLNFNGLLQDTSRVGLLPDGASWVGALDMAGNVWEWVDPSADISANLFEDDAVIVGGSWNSFGSLVQGSYAAPKPRDSRDVFTGFRVAFDADVFERLDSN